jgi:hypothetical protein
MTQQFTYPNSDLDRGRALMAVLGSFWSRTYTAKDQVRSYAESTGALAVQTYRNLLESVWSLSRYEVPVFHREYWTPIVLKRSDLTNGTINNYLFGDGGHVFDEYGSFFDVNLAANFYYFPAPEKLVRVGKLFNKILFPTAALTENVDYIIDGKRGAIIFAENPFENAALLRRTTTTAGEPDEEMLLWGFSGQFDYDTVFEQFAYALGVRLNSSQNYKDLTNAVINGLLNGGATAADLDLALSAITGVPVTIEDEETVEAVAHDNYGLFVATDKHVYRFADHAEPVVNIGQRVRAGAQLVRGFEIDELFVGSAYAQYVSDDPLACCYMPGGLLVANNLNTLATENEADILLDPDTQICISPKKPISSLALGEGYLAACFYGDLIFEDKNVPLIVDTAHESGFTFLSFKLGGIPADVEYFFNELHYRGVTAALKPAPACPPDTQPRFTLAQYLDKRKNRATEPGPEHLPATINPLRFIVENVLRNNVFLVRITLTALGKNRLGLYNVRHLRQLLPPHSAMIVIFELQPGTDVVKAPDFVHESVGQFTGAEQIHEVVSGDDLVRDGGATLRLISGTCQ